MLESDRKIERLFILKLKKYKYLLELSKQQKDILYNDNLVSLSFILKEKFKIMTEIEKIDMEISQYNTEQTEKICRNIKILGEKIMKCERDCLALIKSKRDVLRKQLKIIDNNLKLGSCYRLPFFTKSKFFEIMG